MWPRNGSLTMKTLKFLSLFTGIGGFELGINQAYVAMSNRTTNGGSKKNKATNAKKGSGLVATSGEDARASDGRNSKLLDRSANEGTPVSIGYSEIDPYAIKVFNQHFPNHQNYGDITKINPADLPDFDLLCGGFPCQAFSIAGKRRGFEDTRGTLFFDIARILKAKKPRLLLLENVKGLLSHDGGKTFRTIIATLAELGYDCQWQVCNSKNFGVPQNRERVFIIGHLRGQPRPQVFPLTGSNERNLEQIIGGGQGNRVYHPKGVSVTLASQAGGRGAKTGLYAPTIRASSHKKGDNDTLIARTVRGGAEIADTARSKTGTATK